MFRVLCASYYKIKQTIALYFLGAIQPKEKSTMDCLEEYFYDKKKRYVRTFEQDNEKANANIEKCFYDKEWHLENDTTSMEQKWKTRIMMEWTPLGNVIVFYDVYRNGFAYYSNNMLMDYFLNALAMKYVVLFKCRDFFMDEKLSLTPSPLIQIIKEVEETKDKTQSNGKSHKNIVYKENKALFMKPKSMKPKMDDTKGKASNTGIIARFYAWVYGWFHHPKTDIKKEKEPEKETSKNKFIRLGKIEDFSFIQKVEKKSIFLTTQTEFNTLFDEPKPTLREIKNPTTTATATAEIHYLDYKKLKTI
jgi:hypothetical protein